MKRLIARIIGLATAVALLFCGAGCWDVEELDEISLVTGIGVDALIYGDKYAVTVQTALTGSGTSGGQQGQGQGQGAGQQKSYRLIKESGSSFLNAVSKLNNMNTRRLYYHHNPVIVFGKDLAQKGVKDIMDLMMRAKETRADVWVIVAEGTADKLLSVEVEGEQIPGIAMEKLVRQFAKISAELRTTLVAFINQLLSESSAPIATLMDVEEKDGKQNLVVSGIAMFKGDSMVGALAKEDLDGFFWTLKRRTTGNITLHSEYGEASLEIRESSCRIKPTVKDGKLSMSLNIEATAHIHELAGYREMQLAQVVAYLEKLTEKQIIRQAGNCIAKAQQHRADIFGFAKYVRLRFPKEWEKIKSKWDDVFEKMPVNVEAKVKIIDTGMIKNAFLGEMKQ